MASGAQRLPSQSTQPGVAETSSAGSPSATENTLGGALSLSRTDLAAADSPALNSPKDFSWGD